MSRAKGSTTMPRAQGFHVTNIESCWMRLPAMACAVYVEDKGDHYSATFRKPKGDHEPVGSYTSTVLLTEFRDDCKFAASMLAARQRRAA